MNKKINKKKSNYKKYVAKHTKKYAAQYTPLYNSRIDFDLPENQLCRNLGLAGLSLDFIAKKVKMSRAQVVNRLKILGITVKQYREGRNELSKAMVTSIKNQIYNVKQLNAKLENLIVAK